VILEHVALWTPNLERSRAFYERYFEGKAGARYANPIREAYRTGDGYYESTVLDPDGNRIEIVAVAA